VFGQLSVTGTSGPLQTCDVQVGGMLVVTGVSGPPHTVLLQLDLLVLLVVTGVSGPLQTVLEQDEALTLVPSSVVGSGQVRPPGSDVKVFETLLQSLRVHWLHTVPVVHLSVVLLHVRLPGSLVKVWLVPLQFLRVHWLHTWPAVHWLVVQVMEPGLVL
jgi:hypothetical protein